MNLLSLGEISLTGDITTFCTEFDDVLKLIGMILTIFKIAIPIIIVALGMFDFGKAVVAEKEDEIKKQTKRLLYRVVAGIIIFFVPTIVIFVFEQLGDYSDDKGKVGFEKCEGCLLHPFDPKECGS